MRTSLPNDPYAIAVVDLGCITARLMIGSLTRRGIAAALVTHGRRPAAARAPASTDEAPVLSADLERPGDRAHVLRGLAEMTPLVRAIILCPPRELAGRAPTVVDWSRNAGPLYFVIHHFGQLDSVELVLISSPRVGALDAVDLLDPVAGLVRGISMSAGARRPRLRLWRPRWPDTSPTDRQLAESCVDDCLTTLRQLGICHAEA